MPQKDALSKADRYRKRRPNADSAVFTEPLSFRAQGACPVGPRSDRPAAAFGIGRRLGLVAARSPASPRFLAAWSERRRRSRAGDRRERGRRLYAAVCGAARWLRETPYLGAASAASSRLAAAGPGQGGKVRIREFNASLKWRQARISTVPAGLDVRAEFTFRTRGTVQPRLYRKAIWPGLQPHIR
jgi:hypothetical protein